MLRFIFKGKEMSNSNEEYYVYVYIDPRNYEEFYFGKGIKKRKDSHLSDDSDNEKTQRINDIKKEGLEPIIKVIAKDLTSNEAFLIEKTLIWKLGKTLTNISSGHFSDKFRPHNTMHLNLPYFDYKNGLYYINVGEGESRKWDDCRKYGFLAAGQDPKFSDPLKTLEVGDMVIAYLKLEKNFGGYVGVGRVKEKAVSVNDFKVDNKTLNHYELACTGIYNNCDNANSEYLVKVEWIKTVDRKNGKWQSKSNLFTTPAIKASLQNQQDTIDFIEKGFDINLNALMLED